MTSKLIIGMALLAVLFVMHEVLDVNAVESAAVMEPMGAIHHPPNTGMDRGSSQGRKRRNAEMDHGSSGHGRKRRNAGMGMPNGHGRKRRNAGMGMPNGHGR